MPEKPTNNNLIGCDFDAATAKAVAGKDIVALVTNRNGDKPLCIAGQTGLNFDIESDSTEVTTKDEASNGWSIKFYGAKSWSCSVDGLFPIDDEATDTVAKALKDGEHLCLKICQRKRTDAAVTYTPIRMGLAVVTAYNLEAPNDDNATYSMEFDGSGEPWLCETATEDEITAATLTFPFEASDDVAEG